PDDLRRGDGRLRPHRRVVRDQPLERRPRHHHDGEGADERVRAARRRRHAARDRGSVQGEGLLRRPHVQQPSARMRGGARQHPGVRRRQADRERADDGAADVGSDDGSGAASSVGGRRAIDRPLRSRRARARSHEEDADGAVQRHVRGDAGAREVLPPGRALHVRAVAYVLHEPAVVHHRRRAARSVRDRRSRAGDHRQGGAVAMSNMHEVDYKIFGEDMQYVEVELDPNEAAVAEAGGMFYMDDGIEMETVLGDGSRQPGGLMDILIGAGKRVLIGESLFMTVFGNRSPQKRRVAFAAPYPGKIVPINLSTVGGELIAQKDSFLAAAKGVSIGIAFQKKLGVGLFGGEGFIMERLQGDGWAFVHAGGSLLERTLAPGELLRVDTGCLVALQPTVEYDIEMISGIKTVIFGGEGLFFATLRGPGRVWLQSLPLSRMANRIIAAAPRAGGSHKEEGSILGRIGDLIDGDQ